MYRCNECGVFFENPVREEMEPDTGYSEQVCPQCRSDYFEEAKLCPACGESYTVDDYCDECMEELKAGLLELKDELGITQEDFEQMIAAHFGW